MMLHMNGQAVISLGKILHADDHYNSGLISFFGEVLKNEDIKQTSLGMKLNKDI